VPVWAAVRALAHERAMGSVVHLVETPDEAAEIVLAGVPGRTGVEVSS
jgi:hypothetical protein